MRVCVGSNFLILFLLNNLMFIWVNCHQYHQYYQHHHYHYHKNMVNINSIDSSIGQYLPMIYSIGLISSVFMAAVCGGCWCEIIFFFFKVLFELWWQLAFNIKAGRPTGIKFGSIPFSFSYFSVLSTQIFSPVFLVIYIYWASIDRETRARVIFIEWKREIKNGHRNVLDEQSRR